MSVFNSYRLKLTPLFCALTLGACGGSGGGNSDGAPDPSPSRSAFELALIDIQENVSKKDITGVWLTHITGNTTDSWGYSNGDPATSFQVDATGTMDRKAFLIINEDDDGDLWLQNCEDEDILLTNNNQSIDFSNLAHTVSALQISDNQRITFNFYDEENDTSVIGPYTQNINNTLTAQTTMYKISNRTEFPIGELTFDGATTNIDCFAYETSTEDATVQQFETSFSEQVMINYYDVSGDTDLTLTKEDWLVNGTDQNIDYYIDVNTRTYYEGSFVANEISPLEFLMNIKFDSSSPENTARIVIFN